MVQHVIVIWTNGTTCDQVVEEYLGLVGVVNATFSQDLEFFYWSYRNFTWSIASNSTGDFDVDVQTGTLYIYNKTMVKAPSQPGFRNCLAGSDQTDCGSSTRVDVISPGEGL